MRSIVWSLTCSSLPLWCGHRRWVGTVEAVRQLVRERLGLAWEVRLEIGRRDLHPEGTLAHLARAEVADQRQQRPDLAAGELETGAVGVRAPLRGAQLLDFFQVDAPVPPAHHVG